MKLPEGWNKIKVKNAATVKTGPFGAQLHQSDYVAENGTPIITVEHLSERGLMHKNLPLVSDSDKKRLKQYILSEHDIVFSRVGSVDRSSLITEDEEGWMFSGRLLRIQPEKTKIYSPYLIHFFHTSKFRHRIRSLAVGGTMPSLNTAILSNVKIILPPLPEQKAIADLLSTWDEAIEKTERLIQAKEKIYAYSLTNLLSRKTKERIRIGKFANEISKRNKELLLGHVLSVTNSRGFVLPEEQFERRVASSNLSNYKIVINGQYAYNPSRINVGSIARLDSWDNGILSPMYTVFQLDESKVNSDLFLHWLNSHEARERIRRSAQGTVRETVSFDDFCAIGFPQISLSKQQELAEYFSSLTSEIDLLKQLAEKYKTQKRGLMQKTLTGEWRVKDEIVNKYRET